MTDSTDNARGPERIWHIIDRRGKIAGCPDAHVKPCDDVCNAYTGYIRADLAPAPLADPRVKALLEALREAARQHRIIAGMDLMGASSLAYNAAREAEAALAALSPTGGNDE